MFLSAGSLRRGSMPHQAYQDLINAVSIHIDDFKAVFQLLERTSLHSFVQIR